MTPLRPLLQVLPALALFMLAVAPGAHASRTQFEQWKAAHGKRYTTAAEEERRYAHWLAQLQHVTRHQRATATAAAAPAYDLGLNEFADLSPEEHRGRFLLGGFVPEGWRTALDLGLSHPRVFNGDDTDPPPAVDWRQPANNPKGVKAVTPVRNQGYW